MEKSLEKFIHDHMPKIPWKFIEAVIQMVAEGATVPFIARYRKEKTNNLDEVEIRKIIDLESEYQELVKRKEFILKEVDSQGNLTDELKKRIQFSWSLAEIEELYRPYKRKKKSKATLARDAGIEPFANWIWELGRGGSDDGKTLEIKAKDFTNPAAKFVTYEEVLRGAQAILVEKMANHIDLRKKVRDDYFKEAVLDSKPGKKVKVKSKFENYFAHTESVKSMLEKKNSHRYLAIRRGWKEGELAVNIVSPNDEKLESEFIQEAHPQESSIAKTFLHLAAKTALSVHVLPSIVNEIHKSLKDQADVFAIEVFAENVKKLLLASPFGARCVLGVDPGLRTGCKLALIDKKGNFISHTVLKIQGEKADGEAKVLFNQVLKQIEIDAIAVGNGTGGREAEVFLRKVIKDLGREIPVIMVNESGASIYSASDVAREEFPDLDLTVRGAISIARRLQDPLAELVKIEPKSIGVGQYQHDVVQTTLKKKLDQVVESCVNHVGVDVNTASEHLLRHVAGIGPVIAKNIVSHRKDNGLFKSREELTRISRYSSKAFEQSAGFLRIHGGESKLDATGIHPERYSAVKDMAKEAEVSLSDLVGKSSEKILALREKWIKLIGDFTFDDIVNELQKPGRDPRENFEVFQFRDDIFKVSDLKKDMICNGLVTNVTNFGAFVDIGVHQDGLVHISEIGHKFVQDTQKVLSPGDQVKVRVLAVDEEKSQISLTMRLENKKAEGPRDRPARRASSGKKAGGRGDSRGAGSRNSNSRKKSEGGKSRGGNDRNRKPRPAHKPFNNPFAALQGLKKD